MCLLLLLNTVDRCIEVFFDLSIGRHEGQSICVILKVLTHILDILDRSFVAQIE